jgi:hypothetical protein
VSNMTLDEKLTLLSGASFAQEFSLGNYTGFVKGVPRLGVPPLQMNDGPQGFRDPSHPGTTTCWPSGLTVAATWDASAASAWGAANGAEFAAKGANVMLGPALNVIRLPENGRGFEYLSGEDPILGATLGSEGTCAASQTDAEAAPTHHPMCEPRVSPRRVACAVLLAQSSARCRRRVSSPTQSTTCSTCKRTTADPRKTASCLLSVRMLRRARDGSCTCRLSSRRSVRA